MGKEISFWWDAEKRIRVARAGEKRSLFYEAYRQAFKYGNYSKGSAITAVVTILILIIVVLQFRLMNEKD